MRRAGRQTEGTILRLGMWVGKIEGSTPEAGTRLKAKNAIRNSAAHPVSSTVRRRVGKSARRGLGDSWNLRANNPMGAFGPKEELDTQNRRSFVITTRR